MKSLLILFFSALLLLSITSVSLAGITVGNQTNFSYYFQDNTNAAWGTLSFGSGINATTYGYLGINYRYQDTTVITLDNCSVTYYIKPDLGNITLGYFNYNCGTSYVRTLNNTFSSIKSPIGARLAWSVTKKLSARMGLFLNEINMGEDVYTLGVDYQIPYFGAGADIVKPGGSNYCYVLNSYFQPIPDFKAYLHYGSDQNLDVEKITGLTYAVPIFPLEITAEYNFDQDSANLFGYQLSYKIDKNSTLLYSRAVKSTDLNELRLTLTW